MEQEILLNNNDENGLPLVPFTNGEKIKFYAYGTGIYKLKLSFKNKNETDFICKTIFVEGGNQDEPMHSFLEILDGDIERFQDAEWVNVTCENEVKLRITTTV